MKIGILTQPLHNNYGGILQNFALQSYLRSLGHDVSTINFNSNNHNCRYTSSRLILSCIKRVSKKIMTDENILFVNPQKQNDFYRTPGNYQRKFIESYIKKVEVDEKLTAFFEEQHNFDAYIVGSDQVWRPAFSPYLPNYYLDFVKNDRTKKIAYAASFGVDKWEADKNITARLSQYAKRFNAVSVREESGIELCNKYLGIKATQTLDPTMLICPDVYRNIVKKANENFDIGENRACVYVLDMNKDKESIIKTICKIKHLQIYRVGKPTKFGFPSIESWLNGFDKVDFIITDSFHGTVFSILFNKPFVCLENKDRGSARFISLLGIFSLSSKLVNSLDEFKKRTREILSDIDYVSINKKLSERQSFSRNYLVNSLRL